VQFTTFDIYAIKEKSHKKYARVRDPNVCLSVRLWLICEMFEMVAQLKDLVPDGAESVGTLAAHKPPISKEEAEFMLAMWHRNERVAKGGTPPVAVKPGLKASVASFVAATTVAAAEVARLLHAVSGVEAQQADAEAAEDYAGAAALASELQAAKDAVASSRAVLCAAADASVTALRTLSSSMRPEAETDAATTALAGEGARLVGERERLGSEKELVSLRRKKAEAEAAATAAAFAAAQKSLEAVTVEAREAELAAAEVEVKNVCERKVWVAVEAAGAKVAKAEKALLLSRAALRVILADLEHRKGCSAESLDRVASEEAEIEADAATLVADEVLYAAETDAQRAEAAKRAVACEAATAAAACVDMKAIFTAGDGTAASAVEAAVVRKADAEASEVEAQAAMRATEARHAALRAEAVAATELLQQLKAAMKAAAAVKNFKKADKLDKQTKELVKRAAAAGAEASTLESTLAELGIERDTAVAAVTAANSAVAEAEGGRLGTLRTRAVELQSALCRFATAGGAAGDLWRAAEAAMRAELGLVVDEEADLRSRLGVNDGWSLAEVVPEVEGPLLLTPRAVLNDASCYDEPSTPFGCLNSSFFGFSDSSVDALSPIRCTVGDDHTVSVEVTPCPAMSPAAASAALAEAARGGSADGEASVPLRPPFAKPEGAPPPPVALPPSASPSSLEDPGPLGNGAIELRAACVRFNEADLSGTLPSDVEAFLASHFEADLGAKLEVLGFLSSGAHGAVFKAVLTHPAGSAVAVAVKFQALPDDPALFNNLAAELAFQRHLSPGPGGGGCPHLPGFYGATLLFPPSLPIGVDLPFGPSALCVAMVFEVALEGDVEMRVARARRAFDAGDKKLAAALLPWKLRVRICLQVLTALDFVHNQGLLHRDIKPGNRT
jgi:hypothetical protein